MDRPNLFEALVTSVPDMIRKEGEAGRLLEDDILQTLKDQGFKTLDEFVARRFTNKDIENYFLASGLLTPKQCWDLKKAVGKHSATGASSQVTSRREVEGHGRHGSYSMDDDELNEQLSTEAVSQEDTVRLLLLGKTGTGKSTTGNTILGQERFHTSISFDSVTSVCERHVETRRNTRIEIMDSPGLFDTSKTNDEICTIIIQSVAGMHPGPHAILYVSRVGRYTEEEHAAYGRLKALFNDDVTKYVIAVFTYGDLLERQGTTLTAMLSSPTVPANLKQVIQECGNRYILFNNESHDKQTQVDELLMMVRKMTAENGDRPYTCPKYSNIGEGLEEEVNTRMAKYEEKELKRNKYVQKLQAQTKEAEQKAAETREEFQKKEAQREEEARKVAEKKEKLEQDMENQHAILEAHKQRQQKELDELRQQIAKQQQEAEERMMTNEKLSEERERILEQEREELEKKKRQMQEQAEQQRREEEKKKEAKRKELERLEQERMKILEQQEKKRRKDKEEMDRRDREFEERKARERKAEREEERRREREREREMEELKGRVAENKEPGIIGKVVNGVKCAVSSIVGFFNPFS